jgi:general secretion pathway protein H
MPVFRAVMPGMELRASVRQVAASFRDARNLAILRSTEVAAIVDLDRGVVRVQTGESDSTAPSEIELSQSLGLSLVTTDDQIVGRGVGQIAFFPDGSASGGGLRLEAGAKRIDVLVDWMTGAVHVAE